MATITELLPQLAAGTIAAINKETNKLAGPVETSNPKGYSVGTGGIKPCWLEL